MAFMGYIKHVQVPGMTIPGTTTPGSIITVPRIDSIKRFTASVTGATLTPQAATSNDEYFWIGNALG